MKITGLKCLHADAGCRNFDFLKITTDEGIIGWSEFNESFGGMGVSAVIQHFKPILWGRVGWQSSTRGFSCAWGVFLEGGAFSGWGLSRGNMVCNIWCFCFIEN